MSSCLIESSLAILIQFHAVVAFVVIYVPSYFKRCVKEAKAIAIAWTALKGYL